MLIIWRSFRELNDTLPERLYWVAAGVKSGRSGPIHPPRPAVRADAIAAQDREPVVVDSRLTA